MTIISNGNEYNLSDYNAKYLNYEYEPAGYEPNYFLAGKAITPTFFYNKQTPYDSLTIKTLLDHGTFGDYSALQSIFSKCEIGELGLTNLFAKEVYFDCIMTNSAMTLVFPKMFEMSFTFLAQAYGDTYKSKVSQATKKITINGTKSVNAILTFENCTGTAQLDNIIVNGLKPTEKFIVNGVDKTTTDWSRVKLTKFPGFNPGLNAINVVCDGKITIEYRERW